MWRTMPRRLALPACCWVRADKKRGDYVKKGESLATFYGAADKFEAAAAEYRSGLGYGPEKPEEAPLVYALVTKDGVARY